MESRTMLLSLSRDSMDTVDASIAAGPERGVRPGKDKTR